MTRVTVDLADEEYAWVIALVENKHYKTMSEIIRDSLRRSRPAITKEIGMRT